MDFDHLNKPYMIKALNNQLRLILSLGQFWSTKNAKENNFVAIASIIINMNLQRYQL
jgi:hypothetical protein